MADHLLLDNQLVWFSRGRLFSPLSHPLFAYSSLCEVEDLQVLLFYISMSIGRSFLMV